MEFIAHRINTINELLATPKEFGVEVDLRDYGESLVLQHDPFRDGENFEEYLNHFNHGTLILNIKSEGVEYKALELVKAYNIKNYFFLDSSFPMINSMSRAGEINIALRFSELEGIDTINNMSGKAKWIWVDCFTELPINYQNFKIFKEKDYNLCMVSPDLQGQEEKIVTYKNYLLENGIKFDAICTKSHNIKKWTSW
jgi:hypothetical protein